MSLLLVMAILFCSLSPLILAEFLLGHCLGLFLNAYDFAEASTHLYHSLLLCPGM